MSSLTVIVISVFIVYLAANQGNLVLPMRTIQLARQDSSQDMEKLFTKIRKFQLSTIVNNQLVSQANEKKDEVKNWMKNILRKNNHKIIEHSGADYTAADKSQHFQIQLLRKEKEQEIKRQKAWMDLNELKTMDVSIKKMQKIMAKWTRV